MTIPRLIRIGSVNRVPIRVHVTVPLLAIFFLIAGLDRPLTACAGIGAYLAILMFHELGHQFVAQRLGYHVTAIEVYPFHALCRFDHPESLIDAAKIAWGGVLAQFVMAIPFILRAVHWGYTPYGPLNAILAIAGFSNIAIAFFNLLPIRPLDGATAWRLIPILVSRRERHRHETKPLDYFRDLVDKKRR